MKEISSDYRMVSAEFEKRCPKELADLFNNALKLNSTHRAITSISDKYPARVYFDYCMGYMPRGERFDFITKIKLIHDCGIIYSVPICDYILRKQDIILAMKGFYKYHGITLDKDLRDLKIII